MDKILLYISTERKNFFINEELEAALQVLKQENKKPNACGHLVRLASATIHTDEGNEASVEDACTMTLWHEWAKQDHLQKLYVNQENVTLENENIEKEEECIFSEVPEFYGALRRIQQWHFGGLYITCKDRELVEEWPNFMPLSITSGCSENSDSDQALPAPVNQEEMVDDPTPSTSLPRNREVLSVCEFWRKYNIKNAVDRIVEAWRKINVATVLHAWKPLFTNSKQQPTVEEMLEEDEEQEEQQATQEDDVRPGEPTTLQLTVVLISIARLSEQLQEYDTRPHPRNLICLECKTLYMSRVNARQQARITRYLHKAQPVINALANITLGDDDGTTGDIEVLGDLLLEELPQSFEGFDAEIVKNIICTFWRGHLTLGEERTGDTLLLPECTVQCIHGQPALGTNSKQSYSMMQMATLIRLHYSPLPPTLEGIRSATTEEWKRSNAEGHFDLIPILHFKGFHQTLNMLILSEGGDKEKNYQSEEEGRVLDLLKETPRLTSLHMAAFSHLSLNLSQQINKRLVRASQPVNELTEETKRELEAAASEELLRCLLMIPAPPPILPTTFCSVLPETAVSNIEWAEYIALVKAEAEAEKSSLARRHSGDLLGGLAPPPQTEAILTLEAGQLTKLFTKSGQPIDRVRRKMIKHTSSGQHPFKIKSTLKEVKSLTWPEALYAHHHGIYYNVNEWHEKFVEQCNQKLRVAVVESLEKEGMKMKNPLFKVCFKKLFTVCRPFALDVIGRGSTSKNMEKIARAHVKQVIEFERLKTKKR
ncbi:putative MDM2-binding-containing protein, partial [Homarus americanus]